VSAFNSAGGFGVWAKSTSGDGVHGESAGANNSGVSAFNSAGGYGVWAKATTPTGAPATAGHFEGNVEVTGDVILINSPKSGDLAEDFDLEDDPINGDPGTVLVIDSNGKLSAGVNPYDTRVAGVVSGAGGLKPAIVLQRLAGFRQRSPIALGGKAFCKVDASFGRITPGDLLTTSTTPGHAMKVLDHARASGAIIGKALGSLDVGRGLVPILVALQ
jgi:hypothetical protein